MSRDIPSRLFVYGTLAPAGSGHYLLKPLSGSWHQATVLGRLYPDGLEETDGFPVIDLEQTDTSVSGYLFVSDELHQQWEALDQYEGDGYRRVVVQVHLTDGATVEAFVYTLDRQAIAQNNHLSRSNE